VSAPVAPAVAAATAAAHAAEIAAIMATPKTSIFVSDADHAAKLAAEAAAARVRYRARNDEVAQAIANDEHGVLLAQLQIEMGALKVLVKAEAARKLAKAPSIYGDPFDSNNEARYRFWPKAKETMPLLFYAAWFILASIPAASTENERMHSVAGRICSKYRACMKPSQTERLTLGYYYIRDTVTQKMAEYAARANIADAELIDLAVLDQMLADDLPPALEMGVRSSRSNFRPRTGSMGRRSPSLLPPLLPAPFQDE